MKKWWLWLWLLIFLLLGCNEVETAITPQASVSPTAFPTPETTTSTPTRTNAVIDVAPSEITSNSVAYEGFSVRLTGHYARLSNVACSLGVMAHRSPAKWLLTSDEELIFARGFDEQLNSLAPSGLTLTIEGTWRKWRGPIGCGKRAIVGDVWFIDVERVVDPNPIARVTLTPIAIGQVGTAVPTPIETIAPNQPTNTPVAIATDPLATPIITTTTIFNEPTPTPSSTPIITSTSVGANTTTPTLENTPAIVDSTFTPTPDIQATATPTISGTITSGDGTPTVSGDATATTAPDGATPTPILIGEETNTPTPEVSNTPTATPEIGGSNIITLTEELGSFTLATETLTQDQIHRWPIPIELTNGATAVLTATTFSADPVNMVIAITDAQGNVITEQNVTGTGTPEVLTGVAVEDQVTYYLQISTADGSPATYITTIMYETEITFAFQDVIDYDDSVSTNITTNQEHFWLVEAAAGDSIVIEAIPDANTDVFIELYDPNAERISPAFVNSGSDGVTEIYTRDLPEDGVYIIRIGEWAFDAGSYQITLTTP